MGKVNYFDPRSETPLDDKEFEEDIALAFFINAKHINTKENLELSLSNQLKKIISKFI
ncbi:hypothetical protein NRS6116_01130 [Bacillus subtilis]|nr:hypothetical protein NRS6116_01130 [Bacillus subtilis]